ncbi:22559_t:CDS:2, partial [Racocetra persica]
MDKLPLITGKPKKSSEEVHQEDTESPIPLESKNITLAPIVRVVSQKTVDKHWKPLSEKSRQNFRDILSSTIPVVINGVRGKKKAELQRLLDELISKIDQKLETIPVPKYSKKASFDYNKIHSQNQALEMALANELEQIGQMEIKLEHETLLLEEDTKTLAKLKSDKKAVETRNKMLHRTKLHPLLKNEFKDVIEVDDELIKKHLKPLKDRSSLLWDPEQDHELCEVKKSISSHLLSIEKNTK